MSTRLENIQTLIYELTKDERMRLREWFDEYEGDSWDQQIDLDVKEKKLDDVASKSKKDASDGKFKDV